MTQQPQSCHLYQLFPPTLPPSPSSPLPLSPVDSPIPLTSPSSSRMRVASVQALLECSFLHAGLKLVEVTETFSQDFKSWSFWSKTQHVVNKRNYRITIKLCIDRPIRLPPASYCSCLGLERTSKCLTPSCPPSAWTSQTCWMTVRTIFPEESRFLAGF